MLSVSVYGTLYVGSRALRHLGFPALGTCWSLDIVDYWPLLPGFLLAAATRVYISAVREAVVRQLVLEGVKKPAPG